MTSEHDVIKDDVLEEETEITDDEQVEETEEQTDEHGLSIEDYTAKIEELDTLLTEYRTTSLDAFKRDEMRSMGYTDEQIERYGKHVEGDTESEIKSSVIKLAVDIPPTDNFGDPSLMNGEKAKLKGTDKREIGRQAFQRVKHRLFGGGGRLR